MSNITETLKAKLDELDLDRRLDEWTAATEKAVHRGIERAGELAHEKRDAVGAMVEKATATIDDKTEGKYAEQLGKVRHGVMTGVDKLAAKRPVGEDDLADVVDLRQDDEVKAPKSPWGQHTDSV